MSAPAAVNALRGERLLARLKAQAAPLWTQFQENPRLRLGGLVLAGLLSLYLFDGVLRLADAQRDAAARLTATARGYGELEGVAVWRERAEKARAVRTSLEEGMWIAPSEGVAAAQLAETVSGIFEALGFQNVDARAEPVGAVEGVDAVRLRAVVEGVVQGEPAPEQLLFLLLTAIEGQENVIVVRGADISAGDRLQISLTLEALFRAQTRGTS